ncbi:lysophosphatidylcholine acyltransferase isoform X1 [Anthonomus grandis grandis]|uniref:lysophosphatidylcholine acyltransferase isoform X1 n=1 Tax=Anthonomus grandis grandis TaxID=2921223 RepID=UPI002165A3D0|nr:lysophosphatidylcholine acyltransferase isoform X1 [Anthonomus grandis grandis]
MSAKFAAGISQIECDDTEPLINPFVHKLELHGTYEKIKTAIFTLILVPVRVGLICFFVVTAWMLATVGLFGVTEQELHERPLDGWRKTVLKPFIAKLIFCIYTLGGVKLKVIGRPSSSDEAPLVVLAPHSSFMDSIAMVYMGGPSIVARGETASIPFFGKLINYTQPIYVWRDDPESRQKTVKEIIKRSTSKLDWPQILIFPEGTCTNRSCLISFKNGAFYPGVPIQPVCIRYPNKLDTVTWTWEGPSALKLLWLTLTQPSSHCEVEFLPVYYPNDEEKRNPKLFANNVRAVMAKALGVPVVDYSYSDCKMMTKAKEMNLPFANHLVEVRKLRRKLGLIGTEREEALVRANNYTCRDCSKVTFIEFVEIMRLQTNEQAALQLFKIYDKNNTGLIDLRDYLLGVLATEEDKSTEEILVYAFMLYDIKRNGKLTAENFIKAVSQTLGISQEYGLQIFDQVDRKQLGFVRLDDFLNWATKFIPHLIYNGSEEKPNWKNLEIYRTHDKKID